MEKSYGVRPGAVIGHSPGEVAAAVVAGALSLEDGVRVICRRSALMSRIAGAGAMASVELPADQVLSELMTRDDDDVVIAVVASPQSTVIAGPAQTVRDLVAGWEQRGSSGTGDGRRGRGALSTSRSDPRRAIRGTGRTQPNGTASAVLFRDPVRPAGTAGLRCRLLGGQLASHRAVRRRRAGGGGRRLPGLRRTRPAPAAARRRRADRGRHRRTGGRVWPACKATAAARPVGGPAQRGRRGGLLGAVSRWAAGGRAAAGVDAPSAAHHPRRTGLPGDMAVAPFRHIRC